jgi:hypothetical protein
MCLTGVLALSPNLGCAGHTTKTTKVVTTEEPDGTARSAGDAPVTSDRSVTTTTTTEDDERSPGIIGSSFRLVWAVISFPFRVVGALF